MRIQMKLPMRLESKMLKEMHGWRLAVIPLLVSILLGPTVAAAGESDYYRDLKTGWWWYQDPPKEEPKKEEPKQENKLRRLPSMKVFTREQLWKMHPDDFQELLMDFQKKAVMHLTEESVAEYLEMQEIASKRSLAYANVAAYVQQKNPQLGVPEYSLATPGKVASTRMRNGEIEGRIRAAKDDYALLYFYSPECEFCRAQNGILRYFQEKYGWEIRAYEINSSLASRLNVTIAPSTVLIYRNSRDYFPVSAGVMSLAEIEQRLFRGIRALAGENSPRNFSLYEFQKGGSFDVDRPLPEGDLQ
jgi:conjugal transfer pilus assembly protein TraF